MKPFYIFVSFIVLMSLSCKSSTSTINRMDKETFNSMVANKQFRIESNHAYPQVTSAMQSVLNSGLMSAGNSAGHISLIGNSNYLHISGDSVTSYLPYFGERQMQVAYGGRDSAIEFDGLMENYKTIKNKDESYTITFEAKSNSENFNVFIKLHSNLKSDITLNSTSRSSIQYSGDATNLNK